MQDWNLEPLLQQHSRNETIDQPLPNDPHAYVKVMMQKALDKMCKALTCIQSNSFMEAGFHVGRASTIIDALRDRLDLASGGLASDFDHFYQQLEEWLILVVKNQDIEKLHESIEALNDICDIWSDLPQNNVSHGQFVH